MTATNGNLIAKRIKDADGNARLVVIREFDAFNRMVAEHTVEYSYIITYRGADYRQFERTVQRYDNPNNGEAGSTETQMILYDHDDELIWLSGKTYVSMMNIPGGECLMYDIRSDVDDSKQQLIYPVFNEINSVVAYVGSDGKTLITYEYDAFGNIVDQIRFDSEYSRELISNQNFLLRPIFVGRPALHVKSTLMDFRYRFYDSQAGRFIPRDPISYAGGDNLYAYASNNPVMRHDPFGLADDKFNITLDGQPIEVNCAVPDPPAPGAPSETCNNTNRAKYLLPSKNANCQNRINQAKADNRVIALKKKIQDSGCNVNAIPMECRDCCGPCKAGGWNFGDLIVVCDSDNSANKITEFLLHELTHAEQRCSNKLGNNCADRFIAEYEANRNSGKSKSDSIKDATWSS